MIYYVQEHPDKDAVKYSNISEMSRARNVTSIKENYMDPMSLYTINNIIVHWYKKDIDYWDFDFDTSARKKYMDWQKHRLAVFGCSFHPMVWIGSIV